MREQPQAPPHVTQPILDTFMGNAVAITGCHSYGLARSSCEFDILVVVPERRPCSSMKVGGEYFDVIYMTEKEVMKPTNPEVGVSLASMVQVRDNSWVLSTGLSSNKAMLNENMKKSAEVRLALAIKELSRADEALSRGLVSDSDFWLSSTGYDFALATLYANGTIPAPSHLLQQMKDDSRVHESRFAEWSNSIGLERSSKRSCGKRLEGISVLYDVIRSRQFEPLQGQASELSVEILQRKADHLIESMQPVDCYAFLGYDAIRTLAALLEMRSKDESVEPDYTEIISSLTQGGLKIISQEVIREIGWTRTEKTIGRTIDVMREAIAYQAKRI